MPRTTHMSSLAPWKVMAFGLLLLVAESQDAQNQNARGSADPRSEFKALYHRLLTLEEELAPHQENAGAEIEPVAQDRLDEALAALDEALIAHPETGPTREQLGEARADLETAIAADDAPGVYRAKKEVAVLQRWLDEKQGITPELRELGRRVAEARHLAERSRLRLDPEGLVLLDRVHELRQRLAELKAGIESAKPDRR